MSLFFGEKIENIDRRGLVVRAFKSAAKRAHIEAAAADGVAAASDTVDSLRIAVGAQRRVKRRAIGKHGGRGRRRGARRLYIEKSASRAAA